MVGEWHHWDKTTGFWSHLEDFQFYWRLFLNTSLSSATDGSPKENNVFAHQFNNRFRLNACSCRRWIQLFCISARLLQLWLGLCLWGGWNGSKISLERDIFCFTHKWCGRSTKITVAGSWQWIRNVAIKYSACPRPFMEMQAVSTGKMFAQIWTIYYLKRCMWPTSVQVWIVMRVRVRSMTIWRDQSCRPTFSVLDYAVISRMLTQGQLTVSKHFIKRK